jgi:hypothetical protein
MSGLVMLGAIILGITVLGVIFSVGLLIDHQERVIADLTTENERLKKMLHDIPCQACGIGHPLANCTCKERGRKKS